MFLIYIFSTGSHKINFIAKSGTYSVVGLFLEMSMLPEVELRRLTIPIFFDMMQCEYYSSKDLNLHNHADVARKDQKIKAKFDEVSCRNIMYYVDYYLYIRI